MTKPVELVITIGEKVNLGNYQTANVESTLKVPISESDSVQELHETCMEKLKILNDGAINKLYPRKALDT